MTEKTVLITGAYRGLGFETGRILAKQGWVVFLSARKKEEGEKAALELSREGGKVYFVEMDVTDRGSVEPAVKEVQQKTDRLDCLINNAAYSQDLSPNILDLTSEVFEKTLKANVMGVIEVTQAFYPLLLRAAPSRVVNISSGLASLSQPEAYAPAYALSKTALNMVTVQFALNFMKEKISVNSVCPGWCRTQMGGPDAPRTPEEGAESIAWMVTQCAQEETGGFWRDGKRIDW